MAYAEKYVADDAPGGNDGSTALLPWTLAESFSNAAAGDRVNIKAGSYSIAGGTIANLGTLLSRICFRGYNSTIGDLDAQGRNADGTLNTTNFPVITLTGQLVPNSYNIFQNLNITGALSDWLIDSTAADFVIIVSSRAENTQNNASAHVALLDNDCSFINSDFFCSGASHGTILQADARAVLDGCIVAGVAESGGLCSFPNGVIDGNWFYGGSSAIAVLVEQLTESWYTKNNTGYGIGKMFQFPNSAPLRQFFSVNNHVTDCSNYLDSLYSATGDYPVVEIHNRLRDITTLRNGISDEVLRFAEVDTDTGGPETDYVDAANGDLRLISSASGKDAGMGMANQ